MKKITILIFVLVAGIGTIFASDIQVNGIWYEFDKSPKTATVTFQGSSCGSQLDRYIGNVVIPMSVYYNNEEYRVTRIGDCAFFQCRGLTSSTIPSSVKNIGQTAFYNCSGLSFVEIPNSVIHIEDWAFSNCRFLTSVIFSNGVTSIGEGAFCGCSALSSVNIPNSVTRT